MSTICVILVKHRILYVLGFSKNLVFSTIVCVLGFTNNLVYSTYLYVNAALGLILDLRTCGFIYVQITVNEIVKMTDWCILEVLC